MIEARGLTKRYGATTAVDDCQFTIQPGQVTGFLGPNGAGKSTTMRMVVGLDRPTRGTVTVNGRRTPTHHAPLHEVGTLLDAKAVHTGRSAYHHLRAVAATHGIPRTRVDEVIEMTGLGSVARRRVGGFSLGMGQRLGIAAAMLGDPQTLILDEPVNGLDPEGVLWVRNAGQAPRLPGPHGLLVLAPDERDGADRRPHHRASDAAGCSPTPRSADIVAARPGHRRSGPQPARRRPWSSCLRRAGRRDRLGRGGPAGGHRLHGPDDRRGRRRSRRRRCTSSPRCTAPSRTPTCSSPPRRSSSTPDPSVGPSPVSGPSRRPSDAARMSADDRHPARHARPPVRPPPPGGAFARVVPAEWIKFRTVRSTLWTLAASRRPSMVGMAVLPAWGIGQLDHSGLAPMSRRC